MLGLHPWLVASQGIYQYHSQISIWMIEWDMDPQYQGLQTTIHSKKNLASQTPTCPKIVGSEVVPILTRSVFLAPGHHSPPNPSGILGWEIRRRYQPHVEASESGETKTPTKFPRSWLVNGMTYGNGFTMIGSTTSKSSKLCESLPRLWYLTNLTPPPWNHFVVWIHLWTEWNVDWTALSRVVTTWYGIPNDATWHVRCFIDKLRQQHMAMHSRNLMESANTMPLGHIEACGK